MADAAGANLDAGVQMEKQDRDRPRSSKNKPKDPSTVASSSASMKRHPGRPVGSKNKPKYLLLLYIMLLLLRLPRFTPSSASPVLNAARFSVCC
jgi:hypothetical protein